MSHQKRRVKYSVSAISYIQKVVNVTNLWLLTISEVIWWEHPYCFNDVMNIFTEESVEEEDILTSIHNYGEE